jgi:nitrate reductase gamma subunit
LNAQTLFVVWPYLALAIAAAGFLARLILIKPGEVERGAGAWELLGGKKIWRAGWLLLLAGHVLALAAPRAILRWNGGGDVQVYALEGAGFLCGVLALVGLGGGLRRHLGRGRAPAAGEIADAAFLSALTVSLVSGLVIAARYRWASSWSAATVAPYVRSVAGGQPVAELAAGLPLMVQLHVVAALAAIAVLPLSRVGTALALLVRQAASVAGRPIAALQRAAQGFVRSRGLGEWIWPEEDELDVPPVGARQMAQVGVAARGRRPGRPDAEGIVADDDGGDERVIERPPVATGADAKRPSWPAHGGR